jgi:hypothetical protein
VRDAAVGCGALPVPTNDQEVPSEKKRGRTPFFSPHLRHPWAAGHGRRLRGVLWLNREAADALDAEIRKLDAGQ